MKYIEELKATLDKIKETDLNDFVEAIKHSKRVYVFGNGGSAATASHFVVDLLKLGVRAFCLNDNVPVLTALANDIAYEDVFARQVGSLVTKKDLVIGISGSGQSENVIRGILVANEIGAFTIGLTGFDGGELGAISTMHLNVPVDNMQIAEDVHLAIIHMIRAKL